MTLPRLEAIKAGAAPTPTELWEMAVVCIANHPDNCEQPEPEEIEDAV